MDVGFGLGGHLGTPGVEAASEGFAGVRVDLSPVPEPGEAEDRLLRELFRREQARRIEEAMALGIHLRPGEGEPLPLLSHYFGQPAAVEDIYDSLSQALTIRDRSFLARISLGQGASSRYLPGGSSSVYGPNRLERPEEMMAPTPFYPKLPSGFRDHLVVVKTPRAVVRSFLTARLLLFSLEPFFHLVKPI